MNSDNTITVNNSHNSNDATEIRSPESLCNVTNDLFADDASLYTTNKDITVIEKSLQKSLNLTAEWCKSNRMVIHPDKTKCMVFNKTGRNIRCDIKTNGMLITSVREYKYLGF